MPTPVFLCSAQCGSVVTGTKSTRRHWNAVTGTLTIEPTIVPWTGAKAYKFVSAAAGTGRLEKTGLSGTYRAVSFRFRFEDLPAARTIICEIGGADAVNGAIAYDPAANGGLGGFTARAGAGTDQTWATTPLVDTWYHFDLSLVTTGTATRTVRWAVEGTTQTDATVAVGAASTISYVRHGIVNSSAAVRTGYMADIVHSATSADFPMGKARIEALVPTSDGTHSFTAGDFRYNSAGANVAVGATDVYSYVDDSVDNIADFIRQAVIRTTGYCEVQLSNPTSTAAPWGAALVAGLHASATGANQAGIRWHDGTSEATAFGGVVDASDITLSIQEDVRATAPSGAWTNALAGSLRLRFGFSGDVVGIPYFDSMRVEAAFPEPAGGVTVTPTTASLTTATFAPTVTASDHKTVTPTTAALTLATFAPSVTIGVNVVPTTAALTLATFAPTVTPSDNQTVTPTTASLALATFAPTVAVSNNQTVTPGVAALALTTFAPTVSTPVLATPTTAALTLATFAPTVTATAHQTVTPDVVALTLTTFAPTVTAGGGVVATPDPIALVLSTFAPTVTATAHQTVTPTTAALVLSTFAPTVTAGGSVVATPDPVALVLSLFAPTVTVGGADVIGDATSSTAETNSATVSFTGNAASSTTASTYSATSTVT